MLRFFVAFGCKKISWKEFTRSYVHIDRGKILNKKKTVNFRKTVVNRILKRLRNTKFFFKGRKKGV